MKYLKSAFSAQVIPWRQFIWLLLHALRELPASDVAVVVRGCQKAASALGGQCVSGEEFVWSAFSSTATTVDVMQSFLGQDGPRTLFQLHLLPGMARSVHEFSLFPNENEVLLPVNVKFTVTR